MEFDNNFNYLLVFLFFIVFAFLLALFMKRWKAIVISFIVSITASLLLLFIADQMRYTTFDEVFSERLDSESLIEQITVEAHETYPKIDARTVVEDEETLNAMMNDFRGLELKEQTELHRLDGHYTVRVQVVNEIGESHSATKTIYFMVYENAIDHYEVIDDTDHLKTINELVEDETVEWEIP